MEDFKIVGIDASESEKIARPRVGYFQDVWRRLKANRLATIALFILVLMGIMVLIGPKINGFAYEVVDKTAINEFPNSVHWFGTDKLGRDLFSRVWQAGRVSLAIGLIGAFVTSAIGCIYGGIAAYCGGIVDDIMMRIVEVIISIPYLIVVILISVITQNKSIGTLIFAMTITGWCGIARLVRGQIGRAHV